MIAMIATLPLLFGCAEVPRMADAVAQLAHARERKRDMRGTSGEARNTARMEAVNAYRAVREHHPTARKETAESAFRAGELLRAAGAKAAARTEFSIAVQEGHGTEFRIRARLELGHLERRARRGAKALGEYLAVLADDEACRHHRDEALHWTGRVHADAGRVVDARRAWETVAEDGEDPVDRVRAFDELGLLWIRAGDPEAAAGEWERCRQSLADVALEETETGARVRGAMEHMRTLRSLRETARRRVERERERGVE